MPPIGNEDSEAWVRFERKLRAPGSPICKALNEADLWAEGYTR